MYSTEREATMASMFTDSLNAMLDHAVRAQDGLAVVRIQAREFARRNPETAKSRVWQSFTARLDRATGSVDDVCQSLQHLRDTGSK